MEYKLEVTDAIARGCLERLWEFLREQMAEGKEEIVIQREYCNYMDPILRYVMDKYFKRDPNDKDGVLYGTYTPRGGLNGHCTP
jgi:hypothetical protein